MKRAASLAILLTLLGASEGARAQDGSESQYFSLPEDRDARALADLALEHLRAKRWNEALSALERLILQHGHSILPPAYRDSRDLPSVHAAEPGAADWARHRLRELEPAVLEAWRERHEAQDARALEEARQRGDRRALSRLSRLALLSNHSRRALVVQGDLEFEAGNLGEARAAWEAARALDGADPSAGSSIDRRIALADGLGGPTPERVSPFVRGPSREMGGSTNSLPRRDAAPWFTALDLAPFGSRSEFHPALFPVLAGDRVLVSSSLRLYCLDAFTGELHWQAGPAAGWAELAEDQKNDLFSQVNRSQILVAPAVGGRYVLAALQLPFSVEPDEGWQGIEIQVMIPQRRLFAFDLESGRESWNHAPALAFNAKERRFAPLPARNYAEEMGVAAPPLIAGSRVIVPCYRLQGRIDFQVACYALETGELLWATAVVSGQRPINMFGRPLEEFTCSPAVLAGSRVVVQTDLGSVAALDLFTGEILWESLYRQIPLPDPKTWIPAPRKLVWRVAPPAVVGDVVVATPSDSDEITAFRLDDGRVLWTQSARSLQGLDPKRSLSYDLLAGADENTILLAGEKLGMLRKPGGIASLSPFELSWPPVILEDGEDVRVGSRKLPWPVVGSDAILLASRSARRVFDRASGTERRFLEADNDARFFGNMIVARGALFALGREGIAGFLDWNQLLEGPRSRLLLDPTDDEALLELARLHVRRSEVESASGEPSTALAGLRAARESLEPVRARRLAEEPRDERFLARLAAELYRVLERESALLESEGNRAAALESLAEARGLAPSREALRDCLLAEERILTGGKRRQEALAVLSELERACGDLPFPLPSPRWTDLGLPALDPNRSSPTVPVALWVLFARAEGHATAGELALALEDWHAILARYEAFPLGATRADAAARANITQALGRPEGRAAYAEFEGRAAILYASALEANDAQRLSEVCRLFPHSRAASDADRARLESAYASRDAARMAAILFAPDAILDRARDLERDSLLELGDLLGSAGNSDFELGLLEELAREAPDEPSGLPAHAGRTLTELLQERRERAKSAPALPVRFDERVVSAEERLGLYSFLGSFVRAQDPEETPEEIHVYVVSTPEEQALEAFSSHGGTRPLWRRTFAPQGIDRKACAVSGDRILLGDRNGITALDATGEPVWSTTLGAPVHWLTTQSGIVLAGSGAGRGLSDPARVFACDARSGVRLWSLSLDPAGRWQAPILGGTWAVFLSAIHPRPPHAVVVDLFRGRRVTEVDLDAGGERLDPFGWIAADHLLVPRFVPPQGVKAYDLRTGRELWRRAVPEGERFHSIVELGGQDHWITEADSPGTNGAIYAMDPGQSTLRRLATLTPGEEPIGVPGHTRTRIEGNALYMLTHGSSNEVPIRVFELPNKIRRYALKIAPQDLDLEGVLPFPVASEACIALVFFTLDRSGRREAPNIAFLERGSGDDNSRHPVDMGSLARELGDARRIELRGLGDSLFAIGSGSNVRGLRMQILEKMR